MAKPWLTSDGLIESVKRKIFVPITQNTVTEDDVLAHANSEMLGVVVPSILEFHEEYFVTFTDYTLMPNVGKYAIPERAIGERLRNVFYVDSNGNMYDMVRTNPDDQAFFQKTIGTNNLVHKYFLENNNVVLTQSSVVNVSGVLRMFYFLRPNMLVRDSRAFTVSKFVKQLTFTNVVENDSITINNITYIAKNSPSLSTEFAVGANDTVTANNFVNILPSNLIGEVSIENNVLVYVKYEDSTYTFSNPTTNISVRSDFGFEGEAAVPSNITNRSKIDFIQSHPPFKTKKFDIRLGESAVNGKYLFIDSSNVPSDLEIGDYICSQYETIVPQIPVDVHDGLAEKTCSRILAAIGDQQGLQNTAAKVQQLEDNQSRLLDQRVDGSPVKVLNRNSPARMGKSLTRRWY